MERLKEELDVLIVLGGIEVLEGIVLQMVQEGHFGLQKNLRKGSIPRRTVALRKTGQAYLLSTKYKNVALFPMAVRGRVFENRTQKR